MVKTFKFFGKDYQGDFNANHELAHAVPGLEDEVLINAPRLRHRSSGAPIISGGDGLEICLGFHFFNEEEKQTYYNYRKGIGTSGSGNGTRKVPDKSKELDMLARELKSLGLMDKLSESSRAFAESCIIETPTEKLIKAAATMSDEEKAALRAALGL